MINLTLTNEQYDIFKELWRKALEADIATAQEFNHETADDVYARYQLPSDVLLNDMADAQAERMLNVPMF